MVNIRKSASTSFRKTESFSPRNDREKLLVNAIKNLKTEQEIINFLRDILTLPEIEEMANRITIAQMLLNGDSYQTIANVIGVSTTTVTRVSHWLYSGCGGYFSSLNKKK
jgi:TrpR-related protein YerC/YecD